MKPTEPENYLSPYREAIAKHGAGFEATLWNSKAAQNTRFDVMIDAVEFSGRVILDAGCGHGDFVERLIERRVEFKSFIGIDAFEEQIIEARGRNFTNAIFESGDFASDPSHFHTHEADWIIFSGSLNTMSDDLITQLLEQAFDAAREGIVFNFLSDRPHARFGEKDLRPARRLNTLEFIDWALLHTPRVLFRQDYLDGHDATIAMWHVIEE